MNISKRFFKIIPFLIMLTGCATSPPSDINNICTIYDEEYDWYQASLRAEKYWGIPPHVTMAFIHQESKFQGDAKPPMEYFLWIIPIGRKSSAYGYAQVLDGTWNDYRASTGNWGADRDDFHDAVDFIGWYNAQTIRRNRVNAADAYSLYLAYHEGQGGFARGTHKNKQWLLAVANKVKRRSMMYRGQLASCKDDLDSNWLWRTIFG